MLPDRFDALIDEDKTVDNAAALRRVGAHGAAAVKLSALSPPLLALYRRAGINVDQLIALSLSENHPAQERTWFEAQP